MIKATVYIKLSDESTLNKEVFFGFVQIGNRFLPAGLNESEHGDLLITKIQHDEQVLKSKDDCCGVFVWVDGKHLDVDSALPALTTAGWQN